MRKKTIYEYNGYFFVNQESLETYIVNKIGGNFNNVDVSNTAMFEEEWSDAEEKEVEWSVSGKNGDFIADIFPVLSTISVIARSNLDKKHLNNLIKELQIAVDNL